MRCKPGDLAVVVQTYHFPAALGNVVRVVRAAPTELQRHWKKYGSHVWETEPKWPFCLDSQLRPLRPGEGADETLRIAGLPREKETA